jgi:tetraacyldisaccharide 4'-kinase
VPKLLRSLSGHQVLPLSVLQDPQQKIFAFSGIAVPQSFEGLLQKSGARLVKTFRYADHYSYEAEDIEDMIAAARLSGATMIITTEKDAVRLPVINTSIPCYYLRMEVEILSGEDNFQHAVRRRLPYRVLRRIHFASP